MKKADEDEKGICFVMMPFSKKFKNLWKGPITDAIERAGLKPLRGDAGEFGVNIIMGDVTKSIHESKVIIADISADGAGPNPNVMYELGLAHAAKKRVIILIQEGQNAPFDLTHVRYLRYDADDYEKLENELAECLGTTMEMKEEPADLFPQLKLMSEHDQRELEYLRRKATRVEVFVEPAGADIFFNDRLLGKSPLTLLVNREAPRNTISAAATECVEEYREITNQDLDRGKIELRLEPDSNRNVQWERLVPKWLRLRRKYPNNPVLMRAVAKYLVDAQGSPEARQSALEEAIEEAGDLVRAAPEWYMSHVMYGYILLKAERFDDAYDYFRKAAAFNPHHYVGHFNLAFVDTKRGKPSEAMRYLRRLAQDPEAAESYAHVSDDLFDIWKKEFELLSESAEYGDEYRALVQTLNAPRQAQH